MTSRVASCRCGEIEVVVTGDPVRVSVCHCLACQKRTGSPFAAQARFVPEQVVYRGTPSRWERTADSGHTVTYAFCRNCGSTVYYAGGNYPDLIAIPLGAFDDPYFARPRSSVWTRRQHHWVELVGELERSD